jgi:putative hydrolase
LPIPGNREAWLPILHTRRGQRHYSAFFSNTAHAHQMKKTKDCVVIYHNGHGGERHCTVITSPRGSLAGKDRARPRRRMFSLLQEN